MTVSILSPVYFGALYPSDAYIDPVLKEAVPYNLENSFVDQENFVFVLRNQKDNVCSWLIFPLEVFTNFLNATRALMSQFLKNVTNFANVALDKMGWIQILRDVNSQLHTYQILHLNTATIMNQMFRLTFFYEMEQVPIAIKEQEIDRYCNAEYLRQPDKMIEDIVEGLKTIDLKMQPIMMQQSTEKMELQVHDVAIPNGANITDLSSLKSTKLIFNRRKAIEVILGYDRSLESDGFAYKRQPKNVRTLELYLDFPRAVIEYLLKILDTPKTKKSD